MRLRPFFLLVFGLALVSLGSAAGKEKSRRKPANGPLVGQSH